MLFAVADLLNNGMYHGVEIAELNARAAEKARELSAFNSAIHYVEGGVMSLNHTEMWIEHPDLALLLYSTGAEAAECAGLDEKLDWYCKEVKRKTDISILDKMRVIKIVVERLYSDGQYDELWTACLDTLDQLDCKLPRNKKLQQLVAIQETTIYHLPVESEVEDMAMINDPKKCEAIAFMIKAASFCLGSKNKPLYIVDASAGRKSMV
jgi:hypothetical protein